MAVSRLRLKDLLESRLPTVVGKCAADIPGNAAYVNAAQERLLTCREAGETGWWGGYAELALSVTQASPRIVLPRGVARLIKINACDSPIPLWNQFYEYLAFGSGNWPRLCSTNSTCICEASQVSALRRNTVCTYAELTTPGYGIRVYSNSADNGLRVLFGCKDGNGQRVTTLDGLARVDGCFVNLSAPFADLQLPGTTADLEVSELLGIQKDITINPVYIYQLNLTTGAETLLLTLEPGETVASYAAYYLNQLPTSCCNGTTTGAVQLKAMVKLDLIPAVVPTDYLLIQSKEAIICEAQAVRMTEMDSGAAVEQSLLRHREAVRYLQGELVHREGRESVAISFTPFGKTRLVNDRIGLLQ